MIRIKIFEVSTALTGKELSKLEALGDTLISVNSVVTHERLPLGLGMGSLKVEKVRWIYHFRIEGDQG